MAKRDTPDAYWECSKGCGFKSWNIQEVTKHERKHNTSPTITLKH